MGVSRRSYTARRGVSEAAVRKSIATGRITTLADGTIDPAQADSEWGTQTNPAKQRGLNDRQTGAVHQTGAVQRCSPGRRMMRCQSKNYFPKLLSANESIVQGGRFAGFSAVLNGVPPQVTNF